MINLLIFTPTVPGQLQPATVRSVVGQQFDGRITWEIGRNNPHPGRDMRNVVVQYQQGRELFLAGDYDALLLVEHDMVLPPQAIQKMVSTDAQVVYAPYMLRHGSNVLSTWQYKGDKNLGMSLSFYSRELNAYRKAGYGRVSGVGFGCTLIRREIVQRFPFRGAPESAPDMPFASDCLRAGVVQMGRFDAPCGHIHEGIMLEPFGANSAMTRVLALQDVTVNVAGVSVVLRRGSYASMPLNEALEHARAGYVQITTDTLDPAKRETAIPPKPARRVKRS